MKKIIVSFSLLSLMLTACGGSETTTPANSSSNLGISLDTGALTCKNNMYVSEADKIKYKSDIQELEDSFTEDMSTKEQADTYVQIANIYRYLNNCPESEANYKKADELYPDYFLTSWNLATLYEENEAYPKAIIIFEKIYYNSDDLPIRTQALDRLVSIYLKIESVEDAESIVNNYAAEYAENPEAINEINMLRESINYKKDYLENK